jgi:hypothetical protein
VTERFLIVFAGTELFGGKSENVQSYLLLFSFKKPKFPLEISAFLSLRRLENEFRFLKIIIHLSK